MATLEMAPPATKAPGTQQMVTLRIWRGDAESGGRFVDYSTPVSEGMVVLDAVHQVQAQQAIFFGETPVNTKACAEMDAQAAGSCAQYHANESANYLQSIKFWKTPIQTCADGSKKCVPYAQWVTAWTSITA